MKSRIRVLSAALLVALAPVAEAQTAGDVDAQVKTLDSTTANQGQTQVANRIAASFGTLAGSADNTLALVNALRSGTSVTLTSPTSTTTTATTNTGAGTTTTASGSGTTTTTGGSSTTTTTGGSGTSGGSTTTTSTTITPPTGKMGWGNVFISLALARTALANAGITNPTPDQLQAALTGGTVTSADGTATTLQGVLTMRASGMGWGQIAQAEGTKLGPVVSSIKSANHRLASTARTTTTTSASSPTPSTPSGKSLRLANSSSTTLTTAGGAKLHGKSSGITTASGSTVHGKSGSRGITTASGSTLHGGASKGLVTATGAASSLSSRGLVTASGSTVTPHGHGSFGRGLVTAAGTSVGSTAVTTNPGASHGAGLVTASGAMASGVTTAQGEGSTMHHGRGKGGG